MMKIETKLDALNFLYSFEKYANREKDNIYLFMFPVEVGDEIDIYFIYKEDEQWSVIAEEISPNVYNSSNIKFKDLVDYVYLFKNEINYGIEESEVG